ncbi:MAG TPA: hypothetical protein VES36_05820 [Candidatus Limnocylindrales bacterium]|nr:hypothetical protein [Candidatus Limnocylindrales bacterium]
MDGASGLLLFGAGLAGGIVTAVVGGIADLERLPRYAWRYWLR